MLKFSKLNIIFNLFNKFYTSIIKDKIDILKNIINSSKCNFKSKME